MAEIEVVKVVEVVIASVMRQLAAEVGRVC
jgi:hypothetical protein